MMLPRHTVQKKINNLLGVILISLHLVFTPTKNLGALGEAGCVTSNNLILIKKIKSLRNHGRSENDIFKNNYLGNNCRGDELQAAFLISKLDNINFIKKKRQKLIEKYQESSILNKGKNWELIKYSKGASPHLAIIKLKNLKDRDKLIDFLLNKSIQTSIHYKLPCHRQIF